MGKRPASPFNALVPLIRPVWTGVLANFGIELHFGWGLSYLSPKLPDFPEASYSDAVSIEQ
jgi:hypothetical protein